jgi:hypothetical protein
MTIATNSPTILSARSNWLADPYAAIQIAGCAGIVVGNPADGPGEKVGRKKSAPDLRWLTSS